MTTEYGAAALMFHSVEQEAKEQTGECICPIHTAGKWGPQALGIQRLCPHMQRDPALLGQLDQLSPFSLSRTRLREGTSVRLRVLVSRVTPGGDPCLPVSSSLSRLPALPAWCLYASPGRGIQRGAPDLDIKVLSALLG